VDSRDRLFFCLCLTEKESRMKRRDIIPLLIQVVVTLVNWWRELCRFEGYVGNADTQGRYTSILSTV